MKPHARPVGTLTVAVLLGMSFQAKAEPMPEYPARAGSSWWDPYAYDTATLALFHCDEQNPVEQDADLDALTSSDAPSLMDESKASAKLSGSVVRNARPMGSPAGLNGACKLTADGRFNGGVRFDGGNGKLMVPKESADQLESRTVEFWVKLDELPKERATLAAFTGGNLKPVSLQLLADGAMQLMWNQQPLPVPFRCPAGKWFHVAVQWGFFPPGGRVQARIFVDGREVWRHAFNEYAPPYMCPELKLSDTVLGNDPAGTSGIKGTLDEVRVSGRLRQFYPREPLRADDESARAAVGQPWFRDSADLVFHAAFNRTLKPGLAPTGMSVPPDPAAPAELDSSPEKAKRWFQQGVEGQALVIGKAGSDPVYTGQGILGTQMGAISFWMRPVDWDNYTRDNEFDHIPARTISLFRIMGELPEGERPKGWTQDLPLAMFNITLNPGESVDRLVDFSPGLWTHVAVQWEGSNLTYYVNGKPWPTEDFFAFKVCDSPQYDRKGMHYWLKATASSLSFKDPARKARLEEPHTLIDDFRIYRRPLSGAEIANLSALYNPGIERRPLPPMEMQMTYNGVIGTVQADITALMKDYAAAASGSVRVTRDGDKQPIGMTNAVLDANKHSALSVKTPPMEFASYRVEADIFNSQGGVMGSVTQQFTRTKPAWLGCKAGISDKVMPDWTPVKAAGNVVSILGREIHFSPSGVPEKIVSDGEDILASPISLAISSQGKAIPLAPGAGGIQISASKETRADLKGTQQAADFRVDTESYVEFDGLIWLTVSLVPAQGKQPNLDNLTIRIPYKEHNAGLIQWWSGNPNFRDQRQTWIGATPPGDGVVFRSSDTNKVLRPQAQRGSFIPYVNLTGDRRGLIWFAENDRGWTQNMETPAVSVERHDKTVTLVLTVISSAIKLDGPRSFSFGLYPIPIRKLDPDWRLTPGWGVTPDFNCDETIGPPFSIFNMGVVPDKLDWEAAHQRFVEGGNSQIGARYEATLRQFQKAYGREPRPREIAVPALYWDMQWLRMPEEVCREWMPAWGYGSDYVYYNQELVDFCSWAWDEWLKHGDIKGAYLDDCWVPPMTTLASGVAYQLPDGHIQPGYQFRGYRERFKRMRQISYDRGLAPHLCVHMTHKMLAPFMAFFDVYLDGEDFYSKPPAQGDFIDHWPLDRMRFNNNRKWGLVPTWCSWTGGKEAGIAKKYLAWTFRQERAYAANMALHDIIPSEGGKGDWPVGVDFRQPDTETVPYWDPQGLATHEHETLKVTAWKRPGKCLVLLVNVGEKRVEANVRLDRQAMGFGAGNPGDIRIAHSDPTLLKYFRDDPTLTTSPDTPQADTKTDIMAEDIPEISLEERPEDLPSDQRRAQDPDGKFSWNGGILECPVRRHDYRVFVFTTGNKE